MTLTVVNADLNKDGNFPDEQAIVDQLWELNRKADALGFGFLSALINHVISVYQAKQDRRNLSHILKCNVKDAKEWWSHPHSGLNTRRPKESHQIRQALIASLATLERAIHRARKMIERPADGS